MSTFLTTIRSPRRMAIKPHESSGGWLAAGISIACLARLRGLDSITTLRPDSSGAHSGIVKSALGAPGEFRVDASRPSVARAFRPADRCNQRRRRTAGYTRDVERFFPARSVFRSEIRADRPGKFVVRSASVHVPSLAERNRRSRVDLVLA